MVLSDFVLDTESGLILSLPSVHSTHTTHTTSHLSTVRMLRLMNPIFTSVRVADISVNSGSKQITFPGIECNEFIFLHTELFILIFGLLQLQLTVLWRFLEQIESTCAHWRIFPRVLRE